MRFICISIDIIQKIQTWTCQIIYSRCQNQFFYFHKRKSPFFKYFHCRILQPDPGILSILSTKISPTWAFINDCNSPVESFSFDFLFSHDTNLRKYLCSISIKLRFCIKAVFYTHLINLNRGFIGFKKKKKVLLISLGSHTHKLFWVLMQADRTSSQLQYILLVFHLAKLLLLTDFRHPHVEMLVSMRRADQVFAAWQINELYLQC